MGPTVQPRIGYLDGIRALAIASVLIVHWLSSQLPIGYGGYIGVDVFFVLSGYIITSMLWRSTVTGSIAGRWLTFIRRRIRRLYPALIGMVVGTILLSALIPGAPSDPLDLLPTAALALTQAMSFYAAAEITPPNPYDITWSLAVEWMFYLVWPLLIFAAKRREIAPMKLARASAYIALTVYCLALLQSDRWFYYGPVARVPEIVAGGVLALVLAASSSEAWTGRQKNVTVAVAGLSLAALAAYTMLGPVQWSPVFRFVGAPLTVIATLSLIVVGVRAPASGIVRLLSAPLMTYVGRISYSVYLWHAVPLAILTRNSLPGVSLVVVAIIGVISSLAFSFASYYLLEKPFLKPRVTSLAITPTPDNSTDNANNLFR